VLEITLHNGVDPLTGKQLGLRTGEPGSLGSFEDVFGAWRKQFVHFLIIKLRGNQIIERMYAQLMPAPFLSVLTDDCVRRGRDYNAGGARYNNTYIQFVGLGTLTDSFSAMRQMCFEADAITAGAAASRSADFQSAVSPSCTRQGVEVVSASKPAVASAGFKPAIQQTASLRHSNGPANKTGNGHDEHGLTLAEFVQILDADFTDQEILRQRLLNRTHRYGNDDDEADEITVRIFNTCFEELDGRPDTKGGHYRVEMLPTTCHVYFGSVIGATPDGRRARLPLSEGISPVQGADRHGPTAVIRSAAKIDHLKAGGTLLNMKFTPSVVASEEGVDKWAHLVRGYFKMDGHHVQFNVVRAATLREAREQPELHRDLIVRVAGYSDYFCDLSAELQEEIIARTEHESF
jgi:pyruvate-formate lyase